MDKKDQLQPRNRTRELINNMLTQRQEVLVLLCKVTGLIPFMPNKPVKEVLEEFCQVLMDYIAAAHFGLYQRIAEGTERRQTVMNLAKDIYPRIHHSTQLAVDFNEKYETLEEDGFLKTLPNDLSNLGEVLATRIELEDRLIGAMLGDPPGQR